MADGASRSRASTVQGYRIENPELQKELEVLTASFLVFNRNGDEDEFHDLLRASYCIRQNLLDNNETGHTNDAFRHQNGFETVLAVFEGLAERSCSSGSAEAEYRSLLDIFQANFDILTAALSNHKGNQRYFRQRVNGGGWLGLKRALQIQITGKDVKIHGRLSSLTERAFGCLLACALNDESMITLFSKFKRRLDSTLNVPNPNVEPQPGDAALRSTRQPGIQQTTEAVLAEPKTIVYSLLDNEVDHLASVHNPDAILVMIELWKALENVSPQDDQQRQSFSSAVLYTINHLASLSTANSAALHSAGLLGTVLSYLNTTSLSLSSLLELQKLAMNLLKMGIENLDNAHFLYRNARSSPLIAETLLLSLKSSKTPSYVHFDLSLHGFASVELPGIGRAFPPMVSSAGYTLCLWLQIVQFDPDSHTTIFGTFDASQTCFVLVYIEKDTRNLILQTSVTSTKPSVRFKSASFKEGQWYHIAIAHRRPKTTSSSKASLFVDGEFVEQVKAQYPIPPPSVHGGNDNNNGLPPVNRKANAIQAFLGTPQDLASRLGKGLVSTQWRLASAYLFGDVLSDDLLVVYYELGPRYTGNFQDCLGSFQTYQASAALNLRNESLHPGKEERSDIVSAIRSKAGNLVPESKILLNVSANIVLDENNQNNIDETQLIKSLSKTASKNLRNVTRGGRNALAINGAIPSINEALLHSSGFAVLTGEPTVVVPQSLDDAAWRIGGCSAVGLALLEAAQAPDDIVRSLSALFESVQESWRNSEAMERENGFGILATLLESKLSREPTKTTDTAESPSNSDGSHNYDQDLSMRTLKTILKFVGYQIEKPEDSVINNPLAYRILLVDMEFWRSSAPSVQQLYYEQYNVFAVGSKYHQFNTKRLSRMRILKKWLEALKEDAFTAETIEHFLGAFSSILTRYVSADAMRLLALYITYAIHKPKQQALRRSRSKGIKLNTDVPSRRQTLSSPPSPRPARQQNSFLPALSQLQVALKVLDLYADLLCQKNDVVNIKKFARTVTNKWLLYLLADDEPTVVVLAAKILARLLVTSGSTYVNKFVEKSGGMVIMKHRLKRWWNIPTIWPVCFAVLFGLDLAVIDFARTFDLFSLLEIFAPDGKIVVVYPEILPVLTAMLQNGLMTVTRDQFDPDSPLTEKSNGETSAIKKASTVPSQMRQRSISLNIDLSTPTNNVSPSDQVAGSADLLRTVTRFLSEMHTKSQEFRDFTVSSPYVQELFSVLFPVVVSANPVSAVIELQSRDSALTFKGSDVIMRPLSASSMRNVPIVKTATVKRPPSSNVKPRRMSSYVLVTSDLSQPGPSASRLEPIISPVKSRLQQNLSSPIVEEILELTISVFSDQILSRKEFPGLGLFMRVPPGFQEHQAYFETFILRNTLSQLGNTIKLNQKLLWEPRILTNISRFATHLGEAIYEGWFINGADDTLNFLANILEYLQLPDVSSMKTIRLCNQIVSNIKVVLLRVVLLRLSELEEEESAIETIAFLNKLAYWQTVLLPADDPQEDFLKLVCYLLYNKLIAFDEEVRMATANLWRMLLVQKPGEISEILQHGNSADGNLLVRGFQKIMELDNETFLAWVDDHRDDLGDVLFVALSRDWESFVSVENQKTEDTAKARIGKRREKLRTWVTENTRNNEIYRRYEASADHWRSNIYTAEHLKLQRALQDRQDSRLFHTSAWAKMGRELRRPCGLFDESLTPKWQLDQTEGRNRMRMRFILDEDAHLHDYQPKWRQSQGPLRHRKSIGIRSKPSIANIPAMPDQSQSPQLPAGTQTSVSAGHSTPVVTLGDQADEVEGEDDFEIVDDPRDELEEYEDKNRKVMRSLQRGDQVEHVHNVSRIVGLEAVEGLLILGKGYLYLLDSLFQRSDGEIVNVWQSPPDERDPYLQMISGREAGDRPSFSMKTDYETKSWRWEDVLSISKRRFLFRDVAIEVFFVDGRSYLLTIRTPSLRNELYQKLLKKATNVDDRATSANGEDDWRKESVRNNDDEMQSLGSRFTSVFAAQSASNPTTRRWAKREISNFHYLMLINTMAGRTFNDLTQYPVFPWVLADYTSEELDFSNPRTFRDLTKPMGGQNPERQAEFRERYNSFAEMSDQNAPPFHFGTHYSSAMIVTSYLIRLQPFVHSYLLLQGGSFDHADRLFYSIEKAWSSASRDNMTDVRELIPEFYYLPEFLLNTNEYDFGTRQGNGGGIDNVTLPPWAKGDPKIFIAKHREALESEYVSQHLHQWIDLVFGHKQRGEAALEATNVFHHLSYHGAKDLDTIDDPVERLATIGIIHNFGQTPHQIFQRAHPLREDASHMAKRLDFAAQSLTRLPFPVLETHDRISSMHYSRKHNRLFSSGALRLNIGPAFDTYMEWGFIDGSVRFYTADNRKLIGLFEHVHQGQISYAIFADSKTLITAGTDCTISIWVLISDSKAIDLQPKMTLFGHRSSVTMLAVSRSFRSLMSASSDGQVLLWDLNRLELVRKLTSGKPVECARINDVTGVIMLCRETDVSLWTLNGDLILEQNIFIENNDIISSCAFYEGSGNEYLERNLIFTGHKRGVINVWDVAIRNGRFVLEHVKRMHHMDTAGFNIGASITAILPMAQVVYTGDDDGRVYEWDCIQRQ